MYCTLMVTDREVLNKNGWKISKRTVLICGKLYMKLHNLLKWRHSSKMCGLPACSDSAAVAGALSQVHQTCTFLCLHSQHIFKSYCCHVQRTGHGYAHLQEKAILTYDW